MIVNFTLKNFALDWSVIHLGNAFKSLTSQLAMEKKVLCNAVVIPMDDNEDDVHSYR